MNIDSRYTEHAFTSLPFDSKFLQNVHINDHAIERTATFYATCRKVDDELKWARNIVQMIDYTTLTCDNTESSIKYHCIRAVHPLPDYLFDEKELRTAAVCVYPSRVPEAASILNKIDHDRDIQIAAVATGFPSGQYPLSTRLDEIRFAVQAGATEIDVVVDRSLVLLKRWKELYNEIAEMRDACTPNVHMKTILAVGECGGYENVYKASFVAMLAGSDFIKTSTGKETVNATLPFGLVMMRAIKDFHAVTKRKVGLKPAGGIQTLPVALQWIVLVQQILGDEWLRPALFRFGASGLLDNVLKEIEKKLPVADQKSEGIQLKIK